MYSYQGPEGQLITVNNDSVYDAGRQLWQPRGIVWEMPPPEAIRQRMTSAVVAGTVAELSLDEYQWWAALDWVEPHRSPSAVKRFGNKLIEEAGVEVLQEYSRLRPGPDAPRYRPLLDEIGDADYCLVGVLTNAGQSLMRAVRLRLRDQYVPFKPPLPITIGDIDALMKDGFQPRLLQGDYPDNFADELSDYDELDPDHWGLLAHMMQPHIRAGIFEAADGTASAYDPSADTMRALNFLVADAYLFGAYSARRWGGGSQEEVLQLNVQKVTGRVALGQIDKTAATAQKRGRPADCGTL